MTEMLQEYVDSRGVAITVEHAAGILRGVKLIGLESRNGRRYRESALQAAKLLYENAKVNVNHAKEGPLTPRDYQDRLGVIRNVESHTGEGLFGDLHFNPKHPLAEQLLWDAENNPGNVGLSHNVVARLSYEDDIAVVEEITKVQSVDLVADPATTQGLFEQASTQSASPKEDQSWDALTVDVLELHRPDLVTEMREAEAQSLRNRLEKAEHQTRLSEKRERIYRLLAEHDLAVTNENMDQSQPKQVSQAFFDLLLLLENETVLKQLITERAELAKKIAIEEQQKMKPTAREQWLAGNQVAALPIETSREFASRIKSVCN